MLSRVSRTPQVAHPDRAAERSLSNGCRDGDTIEGSENYYDPRSLGFTRIKGRGRSLTNVPVILHERLGNWARQLRPRFHDLPIRLIETRSSADLDAVLTGVACPVVLIDAGTQLASGLLALDLVLSRAPDALVLFDSHEPHCEASALARELGAAHVLSGFLPAPHVANLMLRWILLARRRIEQSGWSRLSETDLNGTED
jgi:hypothetical protein